MKCLHCEFDQIVFVATASYMSDPTGYSDIKIVASVVSSDHKAIIAFNSPSPVSRGNIFIECRYRKKSLNQNALFLQHLSTVEGLEITGADAQEQFDSFSLQALSLLDRRENNLITANDPDFITPELEASFHRKNKLMRTGRIEETDGITRLIRKKIARWNSVQLKDRSKRYVEKGQAVLQPWMHQDDPEQLDSDLTQRSLCSDLNR